MIYCTGCGKQLDESAFCVHCGAKRGPASSELGLVSVKKNSDVEGSLSPDADKTVAVFRKPLVMGGVGLGMFLLLLVISVSTAQTWVKVDVPAHPETFHSETYLTGSFDVVDDKVSPCWVGQNWYDCINIYVAEYNGTCANYSLSSSGASVCTRYRDMIGEMRAQGNGWSYVSSLGSWGHLAAVAEEKTKRVSNNDYRPAVTHEAVCYLGFIGECKT